jgi:mycothiol synthase
MTDAQPDLPIIAPVPPQETRRALGLVFGYLPPKARDEQIESVLATPPPSDDGLPGLLGAYRQNALMGAAFAQLQPGKTAQVWLPRFLGDMPDDTAVCLLREINRRLAHHQVELAQMLFEEISPAEESVVLRGGYSYLTDLLYLTCPAREFSTTLPFSELVFLPYEPNRRETLKSLIELTYQHSLDCPKLNDVRNMEAVLEGYRSSGVFRPELWSIVRHQAHDVGCLLLADHPEYDNVELVYMGLVPGVRGRGWGVEVARFAEWQTQGLGRAQLVLAVDAANRPGIAMYAAAGFRAWDRRRVYCWDGGAGEGGRDLKFEI